MLLTTELLDMNVLRDTEHSMTDMNSPASFPLLQAAF